MWKYKRSVMPLLLALFLVMSPLKVQAQSSSSNNYRVDQTLFGTGGELDAQSSSFRARQSAGELTIGQTDSLNFRAFAGFNTTDEPYIEFVVTGSNIDLGFLNTASPSTATGTFYVRAWQADGYVIRTESDPPTNTSGTNVQINPMATPGASVPGTEQFGINLVDNATPNVGSDPLQSPDNTFSFGQASANYNTANVFTYNKGDAIAQSAQSSSVTIYTISYLFNISEITTAGEYVFRHILVATGTY